MPPFLPTPLAYNIMRKIPTFHDRKTQTQPTRILCQLITPVTGELIPVIESDLDTRGFQALLGRDVLDQGIFIYNGHRRFLTLAFQRVYRRCCAGRVCGDSFT
jgi:hypothetical protein